MNKKSSNLINKQVSNSKYDLIIVGAGPAGIFAALEYIKNPDNKKKKILLLEKGNNIENRFCPKRKTGNCIGCKPCNITAGFSGAGAYSDGKLTLSPDIGGTLLDYMKRDELSELIKYVDEIYLSYGADPTIYGDEVFADELRKKAIKSNIQLISDKVRHMGTDKSYEIYRLIQEELIKKGVEIKFRTEANNLIIENGKIKGVIDNSENKYFSDTIILSVGRSGASWMTKLCEKCNIETSPGVVDIGVRVEVRDEIMKDINESLYEGKLVYYTPTFDDKVRTFCQNPSGVVACEVYEGTTGPLWTVNGHSYKDKNLKTENTNFALLVSNNFTEPFKDPIKYGRSIARLANMLSGGKVIVQRYGDLKRGRRTTSERLHRNNIKPTLKDAVPGDLSLVLPYRIMTDIREMLEALNNVAPGINSEETLLYGVEVKFYSNKVKVSHSKQNLFESSVKGLYVAGDGAGITRGLIQASVNGVILGRNL